MNQESSEIQFKFCPKCKISIRKSVRYGNHIKKVLIDIDAIKKKQIEGSAVIGVALKHATHEVARLKKPEFVLQDITEIAREIENEVTAPNTFRVTAMKMQLSVLPKLLRLKNILDDLSSASIDIQGYHPARADQDLFDLKLFVLQTYLTSQQQSDIYSEERRISCSIKFLDLYYKLSTQGKSVSQSHLDCITENITKLNNPSSIDQVTQIIEKECLDFIEKLSEVYKVNGLSDQERVEIVKAIGLTKGHWYKCPNGHFYCIGECGGATEESKCPECQATIGGTRHTLARGNRHAGEIDDSSHAAWSDAANLQNFDPDDLARLQL